jgi:hypothetical protein
VGFGLRYLRPSHTKATLGNRVGLNDHVRLASPFAAQAYMLISMPTGISTIFGAFQDILELLDFSAKL